MPEGKYTAARRLRQNLQTIVAATDREITVQQVLTLLEIMLNEGSTGAEVAKALGLSQPSVTRIVDLLSDRPGRAKRRKPSYLVERRFADWDWSLRPLHLTSKGRYLLEELTK